MEADVEADESPMRLTSDLGDTSRGNIHTRRRVASIKAPHRRLLG